MAKTKIYRATMKLPKGGKQAWTDYMQVNVPTPEGIYTNQPIVLATARFRNGLLVTGGVYKSDQPTEYNYKQFLAFDPDGNLIYEPYQPIDVSDHEDFHSDGMIFILNDDESVEYHLKIVEREE